MQKHQVKMISIGRVFSLGNYETTRYTIECAVAPDMDPAALFAELELLIEQMRPVIWTESLQQAYTALIYAKEQGIDLALDPGMQGYTQQLAEYEKQCKGRVETLSKLSKLGGSLIADSVGAISN